MPTGVQNSWSKTAATNATADSAINYAEGQAPSTLNDSARALMAVVRKYYEDTRGGLVTGGIATAFTITTNEVWSAYADGMHVSARMNVANGSAATLNVDGLGAKAIQLAPGLAAPPGAMRAGGVYTFTYYASSDVFILQSAIGMSLKDIGDVFDTAASVAPAGSVLCYGQALSRTTYADLFAAIGTTFGTGDGSSTFNVPDARGRVTAGKDNMGGTSANRLTGLSGGLDGDILGATGGSETHTLTTAQLPVVTPAGTVAITDPGHSHVFNTFVNSGAAVSAPTGAGGGANYGGYSTNTAVTGITAAFTGTAFGSGAAHNNVQPTLILNRCIYTGVF